MVIKKFGISVYINTFDKEYILKFSKDTYIFLSLHIPEEINNKNFSEKAFLIIDWLKDNGYKIICDVSPKTLDILGMNSIDELLSKYKIDFIRLDFGYENKIIELNKKYKIIINASTINEIKTIPENSIFMHNFYLRKDTGLSKDFFNDLNKKIKNKNGKIFTFIPGNLELRGPLYEGLTTLEKQRGENPFINFLDMIRDEYIDGVFIGDVKIDDLSIKMINRYLKDQVILLETQGNFESINKILTIRSDSGENVLRINESRWTNAQHEIFPNNNIDREKGSITIDNIKYKRYMGEIQITRTNLEADERVNVIGKIDSKIVDLLKPLDKIMFINDFK